MAHTKAIPVEKLASNKTLLIAGAAIVAIGGVYIYSQRANSIPASAASSGFTPVNSFGGGLAYDPMSPAGIGPASSGGGDTLTSFAGVGSPTSGGSVSNSPVIVPSNYGNNGDGYWTPSPGQVAPFPSVTGIDPASAELLSQQRLQMEYDFQYNMAVLGETHTVNEANFWLQSDAMNLSRFTTAATIAQTFMLSNNQATMGTVYGPDGQPLIDVNFVNMRDSKHNNWNNRLIQGYNAVATNFQQSNTAIVQARTPVNPYASQASTAPNNPSPTYTAPDTVAGWSPPSTANLPSIPSVAYTPPSYVPTMQNNIAPTVMKSATGGGGYSKNNFHTQEV